MSLDPELARQVYERDGWKCRNCSSRNNLQPHHIVYLSQQGENSLGNLVTLCAACHRGHHDGKLLIDVDTFNGKVYFVWTRGWKPK